MVWDEQTIRRNRDRFVFLSSLPEISQKRSATVRSLAWLAMEEEWINRRIISSFFRVPSRGSSPRGFWKTASASDVLWAHIISGMIALP